MLSQFNPWAVLATIQNKSDELANPANTASRIADPIVYRKAAPAEQCADCRALQSKGVGVLACGTCDQRLAGSQGRLESPTKLVPEN